MFHKCQNEERPEAGGLKHQQHGTEHSPSKPAVRQGPTNISQPFSNQQKRIIRKKKLYATENIKPPPLIPILLPG
ncbi:MAG: hypothetical protein CSB24_04895 [Deltaproteobacteria bacterium]|nr:MAG: hypothetical protein CSB24_04895 [Deltaproteobacteria bacterium]